MKSIITFSCFVLLFTTSFFAQDDTDEWDDYFMPGVGYRVYTPKNHAKLGVYQGVMTEFVIYGRAKGKKSTESGPARVKTYGNLSILRSDADSARDMFSANFGLNLSFESNTDRKWGIPYFGLEVGGLFQRDFSTMQFTPVGGIQLVSTKFILWNAQVGYMYTTKYFDEYSGFQFSSTLNVLLWN